MYAHKILTRELSIISFYSRCDMKLVLPFNMLIFCVRPGVKIVRLCFTWPARLLRTRVLAVSE